MEIPRAKINKITPKNGSPWIISKFDSEQSSYD